MSKGFLVKTVFLVVLAVVLVAIVVVMQARFDYTDAKYGADQTFLDQFVVSGGPIVWFVLLPMSVIMVFLAAEYTVTIRRNKLLPAGIGGRIVRMIRRFGPAGLGANLAEDNDLVSVAVTKAVTKGGGDWFRMRSLLDESLQEQAMRHLRRIEWVNLLGNVSPMVGLFGTVFGMIKLFNEIVKAGGQPQPAQLAGGISVALVTTFWGLFIAIPALATYGVFRNRIETLASDAAAESENIMLEIRIWLKREAKSQQVIKTKPVIREIKSKAAVQPDRSLQPKK